MELNIFKNKVLPLKNPIFRLANKIIGNREDAEEITQETLLRIWQNGDSNSEVAQFASFAIKITRNLAIDKMRSKHYNIKAVDIDDVSYNLKDDNSATEKNYENRDASEIINKIIQTFPIQMREVFHLRDIEGYSTEETAKLLDMEYNNVKVVLSRARKKLRDILINEYDY